MRYAMLIYDNETLYQQKFSQEEQMNELKEYDAFGELAATRSLSPRGDALQSVTNATTVRVREGKMLTTDGPFAETREQLGGFYILNCKDLDEAIEMAGKIPAVNHGSIEIRPVMEFE